MKNGFINPVIAHITSKYGKRVAPRDGASTFHNGVDLATNMGTEIKCPFKGIVKVAGDSGPSGKAVKVVHDNGYVTGYAHLSVINVTLNQRVEQGDILGKTGKSGVATGPCLHFTLRKGTDVNGPTVDPLTIFTFKEEKEVPEEEE